MSYNPSLEDHQALLAAVADKEEKIIKEENHLKRVTTQMFSKVTPEERDKRLMEEMRSGLGEEDDGNEKDDATPDGVYKSINPPVENKKKSKQSRRKELQQKELQKKQAEKKALKKQTADLNR